MRNKNKDNDFKLRPLYSKPKEVQVIKKVKPKNANCRECANMICIKSDGVHCKHWLYGNGSISFLEVVRQEDSNCMYFHVN